MRNGGIQIRVSDMLFILRKRWKTIVGLTLLGLALRLTLGRDRSSALRADGGPIRNLSTAIRTKSHNSYHLSKYQTVEKTIYWLDYKNQLLFLNRTFLK